MASEVYVLARIKAREAWWQLSEEERLEHSKKKGKTYEGIGMKRLARFSVGPSEYIQLYVYPDMESYHKGMMAWAPQGLHVERYHDFDVTLGYDAPPPHVGEMHFFAQDDLPLV